MSICAGFAKAAAGLICRALRPRRPKMTGQARRRLRPAERPRRLLRLAQRRRTMLRRRHRRPAPACCPDQPLISIRRALTPRGRRLGRLHRPHRLHRLRLPLRRSPTMMKRLARSSAPASARLARRALCRPRRQPRPLRQRLPLLPRLPDKLCPARAVSTPSWITC